MLTTQELAPHAIVADLRINNHPLLHETYYLNLALMYAAYGFYVFPVNPNKIPYKGFAWSKLATNNPDEIRAMWQAYPNGRPAFYCRKSGYLVIDTDNKPDKGKYGFKILTDLTRELGMLPKTVLVYTQSNGTHMYFKLPQNRQFKRKIENCIDIRQTITVYAVGFIQKKAVIALLAVILLKISRRFPNYLKNGWIFYQKKLKHAISIRDLNALYHKKR